MSIPTQAEIDASGRSSLGRYWYDPVRKVAWPYDGCYGGDQELIAMVDLEVHPYGTLKPLVWEWIDRPDSFTQTQVAVGTDGVLYWVRRTANDFRWYMERHNESWGSPAVCDSIEHGKQLCWEHYQQQVRSLFVQNGGA